MSFGSHNLPDESSVKAAACPLHRWLPYLKRGRERTKSRLWVRMAGWGATGVAVFYTVIAIKCIAVYVVLPAVVVWWTGGGGGTSAESNDERAQQPAAAAVSDPGDVQAQRDGSAALVDAENADAAAAR